MEPSVRLNLVRRPHATTMCAKVHAATRRNRLATRLTGIFAGRSVGSPGRSKWIFSGNGWRDSRKAVLRAPCVIPHSLYRNGAAPRLALRHSRPMSQLAAEENLPVLMARDFGQGNWRSALGARVMGKVLGKPVFRLRRLNELERKSVSGGSFRSGCGGLPPRSYPTERYPLSSS